MKPAARRSDRRSAFGLRTFIRLLPPPPPPPRMGGSTIRCAGAAGFPGCLIVKPPGGLVCNALPDVVSVGSSGGDAPLVPPRLGGKNPLHTFFTCVAAVPR